MFLAEYVAMTTGASEGVFLKNCVEFITGRKCKLELRCDSSSARAFVRHRQGVGRVRHISCGLLSLQELVKGEVAGYSQQRHVEKHRRPQDKNPRKEKNQSVVELGWGWKWMEMGYHGFI